jgi:hypothetical protein
MCGAPERLSAFGARTFPTVITTSVVQDLNEKSLALIVWCVDYPLRCMYRSRALLNYKNISKQKLQPGWGGGGWGRGVTKMSTKHGPEKFRRYIITESLIWHNIAKKGARSLSAFIVSNIPNIFAHSKRYLLNKYLQNRFFAQDTEKYKEPIHAVIIF